MGLLSLRNDLSLFASGYLEKFFTPEYVASILLAYLVWILTRQFLDLIDEIGLDQRTALGDENVMPDNPVPAHQRMVSLIFTLGIVLVILTAMTRMNLQTIVSTPGLIPKVEFSRFSGAEAGVLLYFVFGLALLSLSRLMSLHTHWNRLRIPISSRKFDETMGSVQPAFPSRSGTDRLASCRQVTASAFSHWYLWRLAFCSTCSCLSHN